NSIQIGFNRENILLLSLNARQAGYQDDALMRFYDRLRTRFSGIPGVRSVTLTNYPLLSNSRIATSITIPGFTGESGSTVLNVGPDFFSTMQIPVILGREINDRDVFSSNRVAVVNEQFVKKYFQRENPIGRRIGVSRNTPADVEIIGVSKTSRLNS